MFSYLKWREDFKALKSESNSDQPVEFTWSRNAWNLLETYFLQHGLGCEKSLFTAKTIDVKMLRFVLKGIWLNALSHCSHRRSQIQCEKQIWSNTESSSVWENADLPERSYTLFYIKPTTLSHQENWIYNIIIMNNVISHVPKCFSLSVNVWKWTVLFKPSEMKSNGSICCLWLCLNSLNKGCRRAQRWVIFLLLIEEGDTPRGVLASDANLEGA